VCSSFPALTFANSSAYIFWDIFYPNLIPSSRWEFSILWSLRSSCVWASLYSGKFLIITLPAKAFRGSCCSWCPIWSCNWLGGWDGSPIYSCDLGCPIWSG
jgi:hypothetical protein